MEATPAAAAASGVSGRTKAILFDAFPILDPRPVFALVGQLYPDKGAELSNTWRTRQFEYTWLRTASQRYYENFWKVTEDALVFAAKTHKLELSPEHRSRLMEAYLELKAYPDVAPALQSLREAGIRLAFLSNLTPKMLETGIKNSRLEGMFDHVLSTDAIRTYKPDPRAYQMGLEAFGFSREELVFAAFAGWDATGAKWFGYRTFWVNRLNFPVEELGVTPDGIGSSLPDLVEFVKKA